MINCNWVIMKVMSYNTGPKERFDMLTVTAKEIQNSIPEMLAGYDITDLDFASNWYGFALDANSNTTGITNRMTYCKVFRIKNTNSITGSGWVRVTSPDSNSWIYKFNANSFDFGELNQDGGRSFLLIDEEELQNPVYIMVTTPNEYQTGWFNILTGSEDFAGDRRYQILDSSFNELITLNESAPNRAFDRYNARIAENNLWGDISSIQPTKRNINDTYSTELIDDPRGNGKIWKISPLMTVGVYYTLYSSVSGQTFYANNPLDLCDRYVYFQGDWNGNYKFLTRQTAGEILDATGRSLNDYDDYYIGVNNAFHGYIRARKYIGEETDGWGNPIPKYMTDRFDVYDLFFENSRWWNAVGRDKIYFNGRPDSVLRHPGYDGTFQTGADYLLRSDANFETSTSSLKPFFGDPTVHGVIKYTGVTYNMENMPYTRTWVDYIKEVRIGEDYTGTFYIKPREYL